VAQRSKKRKNGSRDGVQARCSAEKAEEGANSADAFGTDGGFKPQITGNTEGQEEKSGQRKGKHAQGKEKIGGGG
jgi:hypothetical protein